jgi:protein O-mannosyl-transferase
VTALVIAVRSKRYLLVGWLWFLSTLIPVIGLVQVGDAAMADRYAYIPLIGIFVMVAFGLADLAEACRVNVSARLVPAACILVALAFATHRQLGYWSSSYELWSHTLSVTGPNFIAQDNLGGALVLLGKTDEAYPHFQAAAAINPRDPMSHSNIGAYLQEHGHLGEAVGEYGKTISLTPDSGLLASTYANMGTALRELGDDVRAQKSYEESLQLNPNQFNAWFGFGILLERQGKLDSAILHYERSVELMPTADGYMRVGHVLELEGRKQEALAAYQNALKLFPDSPEVKHALRALSEKR